MPTKPITSSAEDIPAVQKVVSVLWPSFLAAAGATIIFFSVFNPGDLAALLGRPDFTAIGGYTLGFFFFWIVCAVSSQLSRYFCKPCRPPHIHGD